MVDVILTKGLPGSGKSTWAKHQLGLYPNAYKRINKDDLRAMIDNSHFSHDCEDMIIKSRDALILLYVNKGKHVIVDDTNLDPKHETHIKQLVKGLANVKIMDFTSISVEECIQRDLQRAHPVGERVIRSTYNQYLRVKPEYNEDKSLPHAIIVDIDGTLAIQGHRSPYDWSRVSEDTVNETIKNISNRYRQTEGHVIIVSGRDSMCRLNTVSWLLDNDVLHDFMYMRPEGNKQKDFIIKQQIFNENIKGKYYIDYVLDDRDQVVRMWRSMGITCLQVAEGDF